MSRETISIIICSFFVFACITAVRAEPCTTSKCIHASASILQRIDNTVDPCDNFYDFACGAFIEQNYPADESVALDTFTLLKDNIQSQVFSLLSDDNSNTNSTATFKLAKEFLQTCLERNGESEGDEVKTLKEIVGELGGWPLLAGDSWEGANWTMDSTFTKLRRFLGQRADNIFDDASFVVNLENANNPSLRPSETFFSLRNAYFNYIKDLLNFLGASGEASQRDNELNQLLDFGSALGTINLKYQHLSESGDVKEQNLQRTVLYLQWLDLFHPSQMKNIQINETDSVDEGSTFSEEMGKLLHATDPRTLANFVMLRVVDFAAVHSISDLGNIYGKFRRLIDGQQDREQTWKVCIDDLTANLPFAIGKVYVDNFFNSGTKASTQVMFDNIKDELVALITEADWIDKATRSELLSKLQSLVPLIAVPDVGFNEQAISGFYADVNFAERQRLKTLLQLRVVDADNKFQQTYTSAESSNSWKKYLPPTSVAASYSKSDNTIKFSAGILQNVGSGAHTINYLEYGATGFIIAHELGEQISHIVNQLLIGASPSLSEEVRSNFTEKKKCLIEQYDEYEELGIGLHLDGKRTAFENFADNMGIRLAYRAYRGWNEKFTGKRQSLIGLEYTWDQLFWISAGQTWCGVYREEEMRRKVISDSHATERFRVVGPLSNSPEFVKDFNCSQSAPMNRKNKCIIW